MTDDTAITDIKREVKILKALSGHENLVQFYDAFEDNKNVYIVMELCEGGQLFERVLERGRYTEDDAKVVVTQMLNAIAFCHLQGVVHGDLKPENILFSSKDDNSTLKIIDFGLSNYVRPDEQKNDAVGSEHYMAPEVVQQSYNVGADVWSIGIITYVILCGSRPYWARTGSGLAHAILKTDPDFEDEPWPSLSSKSHEFVKRLLHKDPRKRLTAAGALCHPWLKDKFDGKVPLDLHLFKMIKSYFNSSALRKVSLQALVKTLTEDDLCYLKGQFANLKNIKTVLFKSKTDAMNESRVFDWVVEFLESYNALDFDEFCGAALSVHQLEARDQWEQQSRLAYEFISDTSIRGHDVRGKDWIRQNGKLTYVGFLMLLLNEEFQ